MPNFLNVQQPNPNLSNNNGGNPLSSLLSMAQQNAEAQQRAQQEQQVLTGLTMLANPNVYSTSHGAPKPPPVRKKCYGCGKYLDELTDHTNASDCPVKMRKDMEKMRSMMTMIKQESAEPLLPMQNPSQTTMQPPNQMVQPPNQMVPFNQAAPQPQYQAQPAIDIQGRFDEFATKISASTVKMIEEVLHPLSEQIGERFKEVNDNLLDVQTQMPLLKSDLAEVKGKAHHAHQVIHAKMAELEKMIGDVGKVTSRNDTAIGHMADEVAKLNGKASAKPVDILPITRDYHCTEGATGCLPNVATHRCGRY